MEKIVRSKSRLFVDALGIMRLDLASMGTREDAEETVRSAEAFAKKNPALIGLPTLIDMRGVNLQSYIPNRTVFQRSAKLGQPQKVAILGENRFFWIFCRFLFSAAGILETEKKVRLFMSEKEAINWLRTKGP